MFCDSGFKGFLALAYLPHCFSLNLFVVLDVLAHRLLDLLGEVADIKGEELLDLFDSPLEVLCFVLGFGWMLDLNYLQTLVQSFEELVQAVDGCTHCPQLLGELFGCLSDGIRFLNRLIVFTLDFLEQSSVNINLCRCQRACLSDREVSRSLLNLFPKLLYLFLLRCLIETQLFEVTLKLLVIQVELETRDLFDRDSGFGLHTISLLFRLVYYLHKLHYYDD